MTANSDTPDAIIADAARHIERLSEWCHEFAAEKVELQAERDELRRVMQSILDDADLSYYKRNADEWWLLRIERALQNGRSTDV